MYGSLCVFSASLRLRVKLGGFTNSLYAEHPERRWYAKRHAIYDFGDPTFGQSQDKPHYVGRRVDVLGRGIPGQPGDEPAAAIRAYLQTGRTETARLLAQQAVVLLAPEAEMGRVIWPVG